MSEERKDGAKPSTHETNGAGSSEPRAPLTLAEVLEILVKDELLTSVQARDIEGRAMTLRSRVVKDRVGSVRSQAAVRYNASPAEIVSAAALPHPTKPRKRVDEDCIAESLAKAASLPYLKIDPLRLDSNLITKTLSRPFVKRHVAIPLEREGEGLRIAITDPFDSMLLETLASSVQAPLTYVVSSKKDILNIIDRIYGLKSSISKAESELGEHKNSGTLVQLVELHSNAELANSDEHVIAAVDHLLTYAFEQRASDIHLEPRGSDGAVRFRIDGILHDIEVVPLAVHAAIVSRIKVLARMNIAERRRPQDGRIKTQRGEKEVELRVSSIATAFGEKVVIRVFDPTILMADLNDLGFNSRERESYEKWITSPSGLVLVTGPTGSGKTTTLYSTLRYLAGPELNITTIEDPIEMVDSRFCQIQVQQRIDLGFATALRSILRQDPDIIMVGEIRDPETAQMAVQASLTGHLVFSTVHTRDAAGAITRLVDLNVERFLLSSVLRGVLAQRLLRQICPHCGADGHLTPDQVNTLGLKVPVEQRERLKVRWGEGCVDCRHTGLLGRTGVFEMLDIGPRVRGLIKSGQDANEIARAARIEGMETLRESALRKLADGVTTFGEVARLTTDLE
ncbi:MAG: GspE/PulE family protein [Deltaproteobacteria bacterium]|nr:GspE/PulE family protein [Deltaproteobacteria bacterium]